MAPTGVAVGVGVGDLLGVGVGVGVGDPLGVGVGVGVGDPATANAKLHTGPSARDGTLAVGALVLCNSRAVITATTATTPVAINKPMNNNRFRLIVLAPS